jgi:Putative zinc-finger
MTSPLPVAPGAGAGPHPADDELAGYAAGTAGGVDTWSVEAHLAGCPYCRAALSAHVDPGRLARNRSVVLARTAIPDGGRAGRALRRAGLPDHLLSLLAATPSLRLSWLLSVAGALAVVTGEAVLARHGWPGARVTPPGGRRDWPGLMPFLLITPLLTLAGVTAAFQPRLDPAWRLAAAAPFSSCTLLLVRAVCALGPALVLAVGAACLAPGPGWLPAALLLPSLALCALALAAATVVGPVAAAALAAVLWLGPVLALTLRQPPLVAVQWPAQGVCALVLAAATAAVFLRRDRFELGWLR